MSTPEIEIKTKPPSAETVEFMRTFLNSLYNFPTFDIPDGYLGPIFDRAAEMCQDDTLSWWGNINKTNDEKEDQDE
jgi:hypothetical protein